MLAAQIAELGSPPRIVEVDDAAGIRIEAVALNPLDISVGSGVFYGGHPPLPYVPGCEAVGTLEDGTRVYLFGDGHGVARDGFLAERVSVSDALPLALPEAADPAAAATAGSAASGKIAAQASELLGASNVLAVGRAELGRIGDEFGEDGFTVCIDPVWGEPLADALQYAQRHARVVHIGQSAGPTSPLRSADVRGKELVVMGHSNFAMTAEERNRAYLELLDHVAAGRIALDVQRFPLDRAAEAWELQRSGPGGKVVVTLS